MNLVFDKMYSFQDWIFAIFGLQKYCGFGTCQRWHSWSCYHCFFRAGRSSQRGTHFNMLGWCILFEIMLIPILWLSLSDLEVRLAGVVPTLRREITGSWLTWKLQPLFVDLELKAFTKSEEVWRTLQESGVNNVNTYGTVSKWAICINYA